MTTARSESAAQANVRYLIKHHATKMCGGEVKAGLHAPLSSTLDGNEWSVSRPGRVTPWQIAFEM